MLKSGEDAKSANCEHYWQTHNAADAMGLTRAQAGSFVSGGE